MRADPRDHVERSIPALSWVGGLLACVIIAASLWALSWPGGMLGLEVRGKQLYALSLLVAGIGVAVTGGLRLALWQRSGLVLVALLFPFASFVWLSSVTAPMLSLHSRYPAEDALSGDASFFFMFAGAMLASLALPTGTRACSLRSLLAHAAVGLLILALVAMEAGPFRQRDPGRSRIFALGPVLTMLASLRLARPTILCPLWRYADSALDSRRPGI